MSDCKPSFFHKFSVVPAWCVWILRLIAGSTFIFSGFVKGVDIWGTIFKFEEYLGALSLPVWSDVVTVGVFLLCALEFLLGIFLLFGLFRRVIPVIASLFMLFMLCLTLWLAIADPIADCGCFGDAIILSNWETFWKNVVLTLITLILILCNRNVVSLIRPSLQWIALLTCVVYIFIVSLWGYSIQPLIDFRPYKTGSDLISENAEDANADDEEYVFIYRRGEEEIKVGINDEQPDEKDGWEFIDRIETNSPDNNVSKDLRIWSVDGTEDLTDSIDFAGGNYIIVGMPSLKDVSILNAWPLNSLKEKADAAGISMMAVTGSSEEEIELWKDLFMPSYPIYTADDTSIKEAVRGNPGVIYAENNRIIWKTSLGSLSDAGLLAEESEVKIPDFNKNFYEILQPLTGIFICILAFLILLSFVPGIFRFNRGDKANRTVSKMHDTSAQ